jgi:PAS domain-containing protein
VPPRPASRYVLAVLAVPIAIAMRLAIEILFGRPFPYLSFLLAIALASWFLGRLPGVVVVVLSTAVLAYWAPARLIGFAVLGLVMVLLVDFVHRTRMTALEASAEVARQKTTLRRAELQQAELAAIVTSSNDAIVAKDLRGIVTSRNGRCRAAIWLLSG